MMLLLTMFMFCDSDWGNVEDDFVQDVANPISMKDLIEGTGACEDIEDDVVIRETLDLFDFLVCEIFTYL